MQNTNTPVELCFECDGERQHSSFSDATPLIEAIQAAGFPEHYRFFVDGKALSPEQLGRSLSQNRLTDGHVIRVVRRPKQVEKGEIDAQSFQQAIEKIAQRCLRSLNIGDGSMLKINFCFE